MCCCDQLDAHPKVISKLFLYKISRDFLIVPMSIKEAVILIKLLWVSFCVAGPHVVESVESLFFYKDFID